MTDVQVAGGRRRESRDEITTSGCNTSYQKIDLNRRSRVDKNLTGSRVQICFFITEANLRTPSPNTQEHEAPRSDEDPRSRTHAHVTRAFLRDPDPSFDRTPKAHSRS